jgi:succinate dehydrogenase / fumarate reductase iron-sulfur subunit
LRFRRRERQPQERPGLHHQHARLQDPIVLKPLPGMPVIHDLIVDTTGLFKQYHSIKPYVIDDRVPAEHERLQSPEERDELNGSYE